MTDSTIGSRFSLSYLRSPELLPDSQRMRRRIAALIIDLGGLGSLKEIIKSELGIISFGYQSDFPSFMASIELRDVLDIVTIYYNDIGRWDDVNGDHRKLAFINNVRRIFSEENVRYRVDDKGGVHFSVDSEFEHSRISVISSLAASRYASALQSYENAMLCLDAVPPDGKGAIRSAFFAAECTFRLMFPSASQLNGTEVNKYLKPLVDQLFAAQRPAINVSQKQLSSFREWIDGCHFYRHEPGTEEPAQPPLGLAVLIVSQAGAFLRWLAQLDQMQSRRDA
ncbi:hypothetical protein KHC24_13105 [Ancylobacter defluvii]|uniref:hypothetical protein n=1 Tax=Ancylobacter defluvii TaxID=1282440 RepID=UPI001BD1BB09|nr:hypothetical protein [Ancylobacter defluvii]MBS7588271.1 hypothetical protein [Ancylobacter defluvii]